MFQISVKEFVSYISHLNRNKEQYLLNQLTHSKRLLNIFLKSFCANFKIFNEKYKQTYFFKSYNTSYSMFGLELYLRRTTIYLLTLQRSLALSTHVSSTCR